MQSKSTKRKSQEYFAEWDKKIQNTPISFMADMALPVFIFIVLNIFTIVVLIELNIYNLHF